MTMVVQAIEEQGRRHQGKCCRDAYYTIMPNKSELYLEHILYGKRCRLYHACSESRYK